MANETQKLDTLLYLVGPDVSDIYDTMAKTTNSFDEAVTLLTAHFQPLKNLDFEYFSFGQIRQKSNESMDDFVVRLREAGKRCEYVATLDAEIKKQIISGCRSESLKETILAKEGCSLTDILKLARTHEAVKKQMQWITKSEPEYSVKKEPLGAIQHKRPTKSRFDSKSGLSDGQHRKSKGKQENRETRGVSSDSTTKRCFACNGLWPHVGSCPAKDRKCNACGVVGHYVACCKQSSGKQIRALTEIERPQASGDKDQYLFKIDQFRVPSPCMTVLVDGETVDMVIDSGAPKDIIDEQTYGRFKSKAVLGVDPARATAYQQTSELKTLGVFEATIRANGKECRSVVTNFFAFENKNYVF